MASRKGMNLRIDAASRRADAALAGIEKAGRFEIPARPARVRDADLQAALAAEWTADVLEALADASVTGIRRTAAKKVAA